MVGLPIRWRLFLQPDGELNCELDRPKALQVGSAPGFLGE